MEVTEIIGEVYNYEYKIYNYEYLESIKYVKYDNSNFILKGKNENIFFIEGIRDQYLDVNIHQIEYKSNYTISSLNNYFKLSNIGNSNIIIKYKNYYKTLSPNTKMIKGVINGIVSVSNCGVSESSLFILCFRSDDHAFIGKYPIKDSAYSIHNLDTNTKYDLILVDESKTIEQQVSSYRSPVAY